MSEDNNVLIIGGGGREEALKFAMRNSMTDGTVFVGPGNGGTATMLGCKNAGIDVDDNDAIITFAKNNDIRLVIPGPEGPFDNGIVDQFRAETTIPCFGPTKKAALLETSKIFGKTFNKKYGIPTAPSTTHYDYSKAVHQIRRHFNDNDSPLVIKADGPQGGKGVKIAKNYYHALQAISWCFRNDKAVLIEKFLGKDGIAGEEFSLMCTVGEGGFTLPWPVSRDYKKLRDGDDGPNSGGMGAYCPALDMENPDDAKLYQQMCEIAQKTVDGMIAEGTPYVGFLYIGFMVVDGKLNVLEYNCRLGDPETQPLLVSLRSNFLEMCFAALNGTLDSYEARWDLRPTIAVTLATDGYALDTGMVHNDGQVISGLDEVAKMQDVYVFHAGTERKSYVTSTKGGRIITVVAKGATFKEAKGKAYRACEVIQFTGKIYRRDIAYHVV